MPELPDVRIGQVWADNDKRSAGRHIKVVGWAGFSVGGGRPHQAVVALCTAGGVVIRVKSKDTRTRIAINRFRPTSNGYRLIKDVTDTAKYSRDNERGDTRANP